MPSSPVLHEFAIESVLEELRHRFAPLIAAKGLEFRIRGESPPAILRGDSERLRRVLTHIVDNALKFTENGFVELVYRHEDSRSRFEIRDTGGGITPAGPRADL